MSWRIDVPRSRQWVFDTTLTVVGNLLTKLDVRDRVQAAVYAYEGGLVQPGAL